MSIGIGATLALVSIAFAENPGPQKAGPAGQSSGKPAAAEPAPAAPPPEPAPPPYEPQLLRLAEIMGTLAYLRDLCGNNDGAEWRKRMAALIEAEGKTEMRKEELAGAFNRGFRDYQLTYHACTPAANLVITRSLAEGDQIARDITSKYGG